MKLESSSVPLLSCSEMSGTVFDCFDGGVLCALTKPSYDTFAFLFIFVPQIVWSAVCSLLSVLYFRSFFTIIFVP